MTLISTFSNNIRDRLIVTRNGFADIARIATKQDRCRVLRSNRVESRRTQVWATDFCAVEALESQGSDSDDFVKPGVGPDAVLGNNATRLAQS